MPATLTELAARVVDEVLGEDVADVHFADAVDELVFHAMEDAADVVDARFGDVGDVKVFSALVEALATDALSATLGGAAGRKAAGPG